MSLYVDGDECGNLGIAIVIQCLKDYFHEPTRAQSGPKNKLYFDQDVIKKQLASNYLSYITDGLSKVALRALETNEEQVKAHIQTLKNKEKEG
jgi:hypothetical protein